MVIKRTFSRIRTSLAKELLKMRDKINKQYRPGSTMWKTEYARVLNWLGKEKFKRGINP